MVSLSSFICSWSGSSCKPRLNCASASVWRPNRSSARPLHKRSSGSSGLSSSSSPVILIASSAKGVISWISSPSASVTRFLAKAGRIFRWLSMASLRSTRALDSRLRKRTPRGETNSPLALNSASTARHSSSVLGSLAFWASQRKRLMLAGSFFSFCLCSAGSLASSSSATLTAASRLSRANWTFPCLSSAFSLAGSFRRATFVSRRAWSHQPSIMYAAARLECKTEEGAVLMAVV
mmetsp:Transcript_41515/g.129371  ORF Transcript_41515/g.129371 Transcript_41515/m.129371 type:complete len:236 (+) Transcript_41515:894-1601(+)